MAEEFDWDEVLVTKDPDNKEVSVNFKAVDGLPYPGSPASELCVRIYSNETFVHITGSAHWVWLELTAAPDRYVKVRLDFDAGNGIEPPSPSPQYAEFQPGDDRTLKFDLSAGEASDLLQTSNYRATATIEGTSCGVSQATVEFAKNVIPPDPQPEEPAEDGSGPIPGDNPECGPADCGASLALLPGSTTTGLEAYGGLTIWNSVDHPTAVDKKYLTTETISVSGTPYTDDFQMFRDNAGKLIPLISSINAADPINSATWPLFSNWGSGTDVLCTEPGAPFAQDWNANVSSGGGGIYPASGVTDPWNLSYDATESQEYDAMVAANGWADWDKYVYNGASSGGSDSWTNWLTPKTALGPDQYIIYVIRSPRPSIGYRFPWPTYGSGGTEQAASSFDAIIMFWGNGDVHTYESGPTSTGDWVYEYSQSGRLKVYHNAWDPTGITKVKVAGSFTETVTGSALGTGSQSSFTAGFGLAVTINDTVTSFLSFKASNGNLPKIPDFVIAGGAGFLKDRHPLSPFGTLAKDRSMLEGNLSTGLIPLAAYGTRTGYSRAQPFGRVAMAYSPTQAEADAIELAIDKAFASYTPPTHCTRIP